MKITREEKTKVENKLLTILTWGIAMYAVMLFSYRAINIGSLVLTAKNVFLYSSIAIAVIAIILFALGKYFSSKGTDKQSLTKRLYDYSVFSLIVAAGFILTYRFMTYSIKFLAFALTVYLIGAVVYYCNYFTFKKNKNAKFLAFGIYAVVLGALLIVLNGSFSNNLSNIIYSFTYPNMYSAASRVVIYVLGAILAISGIFGIVFGVNKKR